MAVVDLAIIGGRPADAEIVEPPAQRTLGAIFEAAVAQVAAQVVGDRAVDPFETDLLLQDMGAVVAQVEAAGNAERVVEAEAIVERDVDPRGVEAREIRSEEHTSELQSLMRISYAVFCLTKKKKEEQQN